MLASTGTPRFALTGILLDSITFDLVRGVRANLSEDTGNGQLTAFGED